MKFFLLFALLYINLFSYGQNSYYFSAPIPSTGTQIKKIDSKWFGTYSSLEQPSKYIVDENGISLVSTVISSISREQIRESSKYSVRNGFIHGVVEKDSLPCVLKGEFYYFGIQNKEVIIGKGSKNILVKVGENDNYIINTFENGSYIPIKISFIGNTFKIAYFDYDFETKIFRFIDNQNTIQSGEYNLVILSPTEKEMKKLMKSPIWGNTKTFTKK